MEDSQDTNNEDPTPKLKSSPIPILFIPFNNKDNKCNYCGNKYSKTLLFSQKYCKKCLFKFIKDTIGDNATYLDVHISKNETRCIEHEADLCTGNIQEWCIHCSEISYFKQVISPLSFPKYNRILKKLIIKCTCDEPVYHSDTSYVDFLIFFGQVESFLTKKLIPILYLPWWDAKDECIVCKRGLKLVSNCQKSCSHCYTTFIGCRYCLTTNIIFGITEESQCKKCNRTTTINTNIQNIGSGNYDVDEFLYYTRFNTNIYHAISNYINYYNENQVWFYNFIENKLVNNIQPIMELIPYTQIKDFEEIARGGFGIVYKATWLKENKEVAIKKFFSQNIKKFLNEISEGLCVIHEKNFIHRDFHSKNIFLSESGSYQHWQIGDLGLTRHANDILSNNEINEDIEQFNEAEKRRLELLELKKLGPEFTENSNSGLIYTNFSINLLQSNIKPNSLTKRSNIKGYFTRELDFDIDDFQSRSPNINATTTSRSLAPHTNNTNNNGDPTPKLKSSPVPILFIAFNNEENECINCGNEYFKTLLSEQKYCNNCLNKYVQQITDINTYMDVYISENNTQYISMISHFKQIVSPLSSLKYIEEKVEESCKLCGNIIYQSINDINYRFCPDCFLISCEWIDSSLTKKPIPILCLPWWDVSYDCITCGIYLKFISDHQKWCSNCFVIYIGCRYCLTTNIIFGITDKSQCKKCKRIVIITADIANTTSGNYDIDVLLGLDTNKFHMIASFNKYIDNKILNSLQIYEFIRDKFGDKYNPITKWFSYSQINNVKEIARGGFGIIYIANVVEYGTAVILKKFKNSLDESRYFLNELKLHSQLYSRFDVIIKLYGVTRDPQLNENMLVMEYANGGDLHRKILDGERPEITEDTPEIYANLMKRCWDPDPKKRPLIYEILESVSWYNYDYTTKFAVFKQAEERRLELIEMKMLGPEFSVKPHPAAIYTSRSLRSFISKCSSIYSINAFNEKQDYISIEHEFDIDIESQSNGLRSNNDIFQTASLENNDFSKYSTQQGTSISTSRKHIIEEPNIQPQNDGKRIKAEDVG
ncbi:unnamed protein product [Rhizophagus irregularis]|nr:unnamed protein product [Rhizophagus irregularis]